MQLVSSSNYKDIKFVLSGQMGYLKEAEFVQDRKWVLKTFQSEINVPTETEARRKAREIAGEWIRQNKTYDPRHVPKSDQVVYTFEFKLQKSSTVWQSELQQKSETSIEKQALLDLNSGRSLR